jgi:FixJ family two-component response regulator
MKMYLPAMTVLEITGAMPVQPFQDEDDFTEQCEPVGTSVCLANNEKRTMKARILIVDDEPNVRLMYRMALESSGFEVFEADSGTKALNQCMTRRHDVALLDLRMPGGMDGLELLHEMANLNIPTPVVMITAHGDVPNAVSAMKLGAIDFLQKPVLPDELRHIVRDVLIRHEPEEDGEETHDLESCLRRAKKAINLRDFDTARSELINALDLDPGSPQALNLVKVMLEMRGECNQTETGRAPAVEAVKTPAPWTFRRIFNLFRSGSGKEPSDTETL